MTKVKNAKLLENKEVQEEINRHRWLESEKAGTEISFDKAASDWLERFSDGWLAFQAMAAPKRPVKKSAKK